MVESETTYEREAFEMGLMVGGNLTGVERHSRCGKQCEPRWSLEATGTVQRSAGDLARLKGEDRLGRKARKGNLDHPVEDD